MTFEGGKRINRRDFLAGVAAAAVSTGEALAAPAKSGVRSSESAIGLTHSQEALLKSLTFNMSGYDVPRENRHDFKKLKPPSLKLAPQNTKVEHSTLHASEGRYGLVGNLRDIRAGRFERALRFKNITDAVERKYNLPPGILLAMIMQESSGSDLMPNGRDDGGAGLIHMQPHNAARYGLKTFQGNTALVDTAHGQALRDLIVQGKSVFELAQLDERFNRVLNIDAAGRMLATDMSGKRIADLGPFRTAMKRYSGAPNYSKYFDALVQYMTDLDDERTIRTVAMDFDKNNKNLTVNGKGFSPSISPFAMYLATHWQENEKGFDLDTYRKLPSYRPDNSDAVLQTYRNFFIKK